MVSYIWTSTAVQEDHSTWFDNRTWGTLLTGVKFLLWINSPFEAWTEAALSFMSSVYVNQQHIIRIMTWIHREGSQLMSDPLIFFSEFVLNPIWIQVSFILVDGVCLKLGEFYGL